MMYKLMKMTDKTDQVAVTFDIESGEETWAELMTHFVAFLRASGFVIKAEDLREWASCVEVE